MKRDDNVYLQHMRDASVRIDYYLNGIDKPQFDANARLQDGVIRQMEIVGEAAKRVSNDTRKKYPEIPRQDIAGMRDKLVHDYFGFDMNTVWLTAKEDIPVLRGQIERILGDMGE